MVTRHFVINRLEKKKSNGIKWPRSGKNVGLDLGHRLSWPWLTLHILKGRQIDDPLGITTYFTNAIFLCPSLDHKPGHVSVVTSYFLQEKDMQCFKIKSNQNLMIHPCDYVGRDNSKRILAGPKMVTQQKPWKTINPRKNAREKKPCVESMEDNARDNLIERWECGKLRWGLRKMKW